jgi:hypothetical protein
MRLRRLPVGLLATAVLAVLAACTTTVTVTDGKWTATCVDTLPDDCDGVVELFVNNLARSSEAVWQASGGRVVVQPVPCPELEDWADPNGGCWRAIAPVPPDAHRACMLVARQKDPANALGPFGQAGGDNYSGLLGAPQPGTTPC